jgi:biopolymer transport protein ExbB/TolQ
MIPGLYTYVATGLIAGSIAATGAWQVQNWRWKANTAQAEKAMQQERDSWRDKAQAAEQVARDQLDDNRRRADAAAATHGANIARLNAQLKGAKNEVSRLSDNLSACKLSPDLVRLLNDQRNAVNAGETKD